MRINELLESLDSPWNLVPASAAINDGLSYAGLTKFSAYQNKDDMRQIMFIAYIDGAWEVHHAVMNNTGYPTSGVRLKPDEGLGSANTGFVASALKLYMDKLENGSAIRIVAPYDTGTKSLWSSYERIIARLIARNPEKYQPSEPDYNYINSQGIRSISQVIKPWGGKKHIEEALLGIKKLK